MHLPDLPEHGDVVEWIESHGDSAEPETLADSLQELAEQGETLQSIVDTALTLKTRKPKRAALAPYESFPVDALPAPPWFDENAGMKQSERLAAVEPGFYPTTNPLFSGAPVSDLEISVFTSRRDAKNASRSR